MRPRRDGLLDRRADRRALHASAYASNTANASASPAVDGLSLSHLVSLVASELGAAVLEPHLRIVEKEKK